MPNADLTYFDDYVNAGTFFGRSIFWDGLHKLNL